MSSPIQGGGSSGYKSSATSPINQQDFPSASQVDSLSSNSQVEARTNDIGNKILGSGSSENFPQTRSFSALSSSSSNTTSGTTPTSQNIHNSIDVFTKIKTQIFNDETQYIKLMKNDDFVNLFNACDQAFINPIDANDLDTKLNTFIKKLGDWTALTHQDQRLIKQEATELKKFIDDLKKSSPHQENNTGNNQQNLSYFPNLEDIPAISSATTPIGGDDTFEDSSLNTSTSFSSSIDDAEEEAEENANLNAPITSSRYSSPNEEVKANFFSRIFDRIRGKTSPSAVTEAQSETTTTNITSNKEELNSVNEKKLNSVLVILKNNGFPEENFGKLKEAAEPLLLAIASSQDQHYILKLLSLYKTSETDQKNKFDWDKLIEQLKELRTINSLNIDNKIDILSTLAKTIIDFGNLKPKPDEVITFLENTIAKIKDEFTNAPYNKGRISIIILREYPNAFITKSPPKL